MTDGNGSPQNRSMELWTPASLSLAALAGTPEQLTVVEELTKILLSEGGDDYEAHYASLRDVNPDAISQALSTFFRPTLRTILGQLRQVGDTLSYPVAIARGSGYRRDWAQYVLRRVNLTRLSSDPRASFERLHEEFDAVSYFHNSTKEKKSKESSDGKSVHYNVFATKGDVKLYLGFVKAYRQRFGERFDDHRRNKQNLTQCFGFKDDDIIAQVTNYNPHPFEKNVGFYYDVGIDTSDVDRQILEQIAAALFNEMVSGLTIYINDADYITAHHSRYVDGVREANPDFEKVLARIGFQGYDKSADFIKVNPYRPS